MVIINRELKRHEVICPHCGKLIATGRSFLEARDRAMAAGAKVVLGHFFCNRACANEWRAALIKAEEKQKQYERGLA